MFLQSKKPKAIPLVEWLTKKGIEKNTGRALTSHRRKDAALAYCDGQIEALEFMNEEERQEILRKQARSPP